MKQSTKNQEPRTVANATTNQAPSTKNQEHDDLPVVVYRPHQRHEMSWFACWAEMSRNIWAARELVWQLFKRDFTAGYKKSFVGVAWVLVSPIMGIISWVFLWKTGLYNPGESDVPFPVYVLLGNCMWGLFMGFYDAAGGTLAAGGALMLQVKFPHEALLFKQLAMFLANFLLSFITNIVVMLLFGVMPSWGLLALPLVALPLFFLGAAMGLIVAMIRVVAFDLDRIIGIAMQFLKYTTPIIFTNKVPSPLIQAIIKYNPLTYLVCSARDMVLHGTVYNSAWGIYSACVGVCFVFFMIAWRLFYVSEHQLVERMI